MIKRFSLFAITVFTLTNTSAAQNNPLDGWTQSQQGERVLLNHQSGNGSILIMPVLDLDGTPINFEGEPVNLDVLIALAAASRSELKWCPGLSKAKTVAILEGKGRLKQVQDATANCALFIVEGSDKPVSITAVDMRNSGVDSFAAAQALIAIATKNSTRNSDNVAFNGPSQQPVVVTKAATAVLPPDKRPVMAFVQSTSGFSGWPPVATFNVHNYFMFPGGLVADCDDIDTTDAVELDKREDCRAGTWRKKGEGYDVKFVDSSDAVYVDPEETIPPLPKGTLLDLNVGNVSGISFNGGASVASTMREGQMFFTKAGRFGVGSSSSTNFSGSNAVAYSGSQNVPLVGKYSIDGYVLTVTKDDGSIVHRYMAALKSSSKNGYHVYFEGDHYWEDSD
jgi:hypothetical protein